MSEGQPNLEGSDKVDPAPASEEAAGALEPQDRLALAVQAAAAMLRPARNIPAVARAAHLMTPEQSFGAAGRARLMRNLQGKVGNTGLERMVGRVKTPPEERPDEFIVDRVAQLQTMIQALSGQLQAETEAMKTALAGAGQAQAEAIRQAIDQHRADLRRQMARSRAQVAADAETSRRQLSDLIRRTQARASARAAGQARAIMAVAAGHKKEAADLVEASRQEARQFGANAGQRGRAALDQQAQKARQEGQTKAISYDWSSRGGRAQARAVLTVAQETEAQLAQAGLDLQEAATRAGQAVADDMIEIENELIDRLEIQLAEMLRQLEAGWRARRQQFEALTANSYQQLEQQAAETNRSLRQAEMRAEAQLRRLTEGGSRRVRDSVTQPQARMDQRLVSTLSEINYVVNTTAFAIEQMRRPRVEDIEGVIEQGRTEIQAMADQRLAALPGERDMVIIRLAEEGAKVENQAAEITATVIRTGAAIWAAAGRGYKAGVKTAQAGADQIDENWSKSLSETKAVAEKHFADLLAGMKIELDQQLQAGQEEIARRADQVLRQNREPLVSLEVRMEAAANKASQKYEPSQPQAGKQRWSRLRSILMKLKSIAQIGK